MKTFAALSAAALIGLGTLASSAANAHPGPYHGRGHGHGGPYGYAPAYRYDGPVYGPRRFVEYGARHHRWHRHWDRPAYRGGW